ncbi:hypothetical protein NSERUTF1_4214 [Nocardia seriolae]|nr:hypothetical protein NSERUTF1_4214 [Nocardia seriolae]
MIGPLAAVPPAEHWGSGTLGVPPRGLTHGRILTVYSDSALFALFAPLSPL